MGTIKYNILLVGISLVCMLFGQLSNRDSLSDLVLCLLTQPHKWYKHIYFFRLKFISIGGSASGNSFIPFKF